MQNVATPGATPGGDMGNQSKDKDFVDAYLSTPRFIKFLTDLSNDVMKQPSKEEKKLFV